MTRDPHLLIINRVCFLTFLLKLSRQIPVMAVRVYSLFFAILSTGGYLGVAGKGNQGDPIKLEILPDKFIGPSFGGQHPGANLG